ncbi:MAG: TolC family protein [Elusimicrobia bacterium]|nr:TolC family protein [Elusimicrobiota bacterium]
MVTLALAALLAAPVPAAASDAKPVALDEAYAAALKRSEELAQRGYTYAQIQAQIDELWSVVKPRLQLNATHSWQDTPGAGVNFPLPANQDTVAVNGHQPIFAGLRDFLAVRAARAQGESAELALTRAKHVLYQDVAKAYLDLLQARRAVATREAESKLTEGRIKELENFVDLGRSRRSEVLAAQAQHAQDEADLASALGDERLRQAALRFLTGLDDDLAPAEVASPDAPGEVAPFLERAARRPDVEAARKDLEYADTFVTMQGRQYWPTVGVDGNYYLRRPQNFSKNVHWDAALTAVLPIYNGGLIAAQVREAKAQRGVREQALTLALRKAELEVRQAHADLLSDLAVLAALQRALGLAQANAKAQAEDYRHGLVTNIDVLTSLTTVQNTELRLDQARLRAFDDRVRLETAAGAPGSVK